MSNLEDDFKDVRGALDYYLGGEPAAFKRIAEAVQEASAILIRARHICQALTIHDGSMEASVVREIDAWRKKQGLER